MASVIPQKKVLIPRHSEVYGRVIPRLGTEENPASAYITDSMILSETCFGIEFREFDSIFFSRNDILIIFLLGTVRDGHGMAYTVNPSINVWYN
jgi:hypothetical protein